MSHFFLQYLLNIQAHFNSDNLLKIVVLVEKGIVKGLESKRKKNKHFILATQRRRIKKPSTPIRQSNRAQTRIWCENKM